MAIESNRFFGDEPSVRSSGAEKMFASMSLPDFQYVLNRQTAGARSKTLTQFWRRGQLGATPGISTNSQRITRWDFRAGNQRIY
jgi:hypothetical protein